MQELVESRANPTTTNADVQWGPVIAGALAGTAVASVLMGFAAALGLLVASPSPSWRDTSVWLTLLSGVWMLLVYVFSFGLAGYVAGRMRSPFTGADPNEIEFRDGMHGLLAWALGVIIGALLLWATITAVASTRTGATAGEAAGASEPVYLAFELDCSALTDDRPTRTNRRAGPKRGASSERGSAGAIWPARIALISCDWSRRAPGFRLKTPSGAWRR
jgi:hypothetical protein